MQKSIKILQMEKDLAKAKAEEAKETGFTVVVVDTETGDLKEIKAKSHELTEKEKSDIMSAAGKLGDNLDEIQGMSKVLDSTVGTWLKFMTLIDNPLKEIVATMFNLEKEIVSTLPNIELLGLIFGENQWINEKASNLATELNYISSKNK